MDEPLYVTAIEIIRNPDSTDGEIVRALNAIWREGFEYGKSSAFE